MWVEPASGFDLSYAERDLAATVDSFLSLVVILVGDSRNGLFGVGPNLLCDGLPSVLTSECLL